MVDRAAKDVKGRSVDPADPACTAEPEPRSGAAPDPIRVIRLWDGPVGVNRFSSPSVADLNGDSVADVVVAGGVQNRTGSVSALDGATGRQLWKRTFSDELYATPLLTRVNQDAIADVVVGGRIKDELALDGLTGATIWSMVAANPGLETNNAATGSPTRVPDLDADGFEDVVFTQSGDTGDRDPRPPGLFRFTSAASGRVLFTFVAPDGQEVYSVPSVEQDPTADRTVVLTYGSGGSRLPGHLTRIRVPFTTPGVAPIVPRLWEHESKPLGITSSPIVTESASGTRNIYATEFEGRVVRIDATRGTTCWRSRRLPGVLPTTAAVGRFAGMASPGVVIKTLSGQGQLLWLDPRDGRVVARARVGAESWASPLTADLNGDGLDEVVLSAVTDVPPGGFEQPSAKARTHLLIFDGRTRRVLIDRVLPGWSSATPTIVDLDLDGRLDVLVPHFDRLTRFAIAGAAAPTTVVGQYRGPAGDGVIPRPR